MKNKLEYLLIAIICLIVSFFISKYCYQLMLIQGVSMEPAYHDWQFVWLDKRNNLYTYGDVIAFQCKTLDRVLVKRVVAMPGDSVHIENGTLYINGKLSDIYPEHGMFDEPGIAAGVVLVNDNQYFVIGDNIKESRDSRYEKIGLIDGSDIIGKIVE